MYTLDPWVVRWEQAIKRALFTESEKKQYFVKFNVDGLLRGDYQSRMNGYAVGGRGGEIYDLAPGGEGEKAAKAIYYELEPITPTKDRGVKFGPKLYELKKTIAPAVLVEVAFHDNEEDAKWIIANIEKIGIALAKGVLKYFGIEYVSESYEIVEAVKVLKGKGIITDIDYWTSNAVTGRIVRGELAAALIKRVASVLKEEI